MRALSDFFEVMTHHPGIFVHRACFFSAFSGSVLAISEALRNAIWPTAFFPRFIKRHGSVIRWHGAAIAASIALRRTSPGTSVVSNLLTVRRFRRASLTALVSSLALSVAEVYHARNSSNSISLLPSTSRCLNSADTSSTLASISSILKTSNSSDSLMLPEPSVSIKEKTSAACSSERLFETGGRLFPAFRDPNADLGNAVLEETECRLGGNT
mmetsp:Transcript_53376/g.79326  ORF Transcript_53376/g.79326 Transcript_53376/m.79326 type:complete len:213 (-) Transcript_53376:142-780(-)